jgi:hypothetical protein
MIEHAANYFAFLIFATALVAVVAGGLVALGAAFTGTDA